jgi:hypothetical protein
MPAGQHMVMGRCAFDALPAWEREVWQNRREAIAANSLVPDEYFHAKERYAKYCVMGNGQVIPHGPTDDDWATCVFARARSLEPHRYTILYYLGKLVETIGAGDIGESAMFAGVFGHFLQDCSQPAHLMHNDRLYELVERPEGRYLNLHRKLDGADPDEEALRQIEPRLLGTTVVEASFHLRAQYESMIQRSLKALVPLISAAYAGDTAAMTRAITGPYRTATFLTASAWHTAHCIAAQRFDQRDLGQLNRVALSGVPYTSGFSIDPYGFRPLMDEAADGRGHTLPLSLKVESGHGAGKPETFSKGIAMSWGDILYDIPGGTYREFRAKIGLLSSVADDAQAIFKVVLDASAVVYEEGEKRIVDCGGPIVYDSGVIGGSDPGRDIVIPLGEAGRLTLIVECPAENTQAIWADPVLVK